MRYERELELALHASAQASKVIMEQYAVFEAIPDAHASISTQADKDSQDTIIKLIRESFPDDAICAEESTSSLAAVSQQGERLWIVDPIDGTRGFARKNGEFSVMIGFVHEGKIAVGVVEEPAQNRITYATPGNGCWVKEGENGEPTRSSVTENAKLADSMLTQSHSKRTTPMESPIAKLLGVKSVRESYSAGVKLAFVARGEADLYINTYTGFSDWDICAGEILVTEAGGRVSGLSGEPLVYGLPGSRQTYGLLATNGHVHDEALERLRDR